VRGEGERDGTVTRAELLGDERGTERIEARAAVLGRYREPGEADRRKLRQERHREFALLAPPRRARHDAVADECADRVADRELVVPVAKVH